MWEDDDGGSLADLESRRRATLLESEAEELRQRLDALLAEIGRHGGRRGSVELAMLRRYAPVLLAAVVATTGLLGYLGWRRRRRLAAWARLGARLTSLV
jgi:hypothetical protein